MRSTFAISRFSCWTLWILSRLFRRRRRKKSCILEKENRHPQQELPCGCSPCSVRRCGLLECRQTEVGGEKSFCRNAGVWAKDQLAQVNKALRKRRRTWRNLRRRWLLGEMFLRRRRRVWHLWRRRRMPSEVVVTKCFPPQKFRESFLRTTKLP